jgi:hypothetical protein
MLIAKFLQFLFYRCIVLYEGDVLCNRFRFRGGGMGYMPSIVILFIVEITREDVYVGFRINVFSNKKTWQIYSMVSEVVEKIPVTFRGST